MHLDFNVKGLYGEGARGCAKSEKLDTRFAKDRHGLAMGVNAIYTMTTIASLLAQSAYVRPRKGASGEGGEEKDELLRHTERQEIPLAGEESRGMFVVRVIWPIKPRGGARSTPRRRSRIDDRRAGERTLGTEG